MELTKLLEELENELTESRTGLFTKKAMVDVQKCLSILAEIRECLPEQLGDMGYILRESERVRKQAQDQAAMMIREAESRAAYLVDESNIVKSALAEAEDIKRQTRAETERIESTSLDRLEQMLFSTERALSEALSVVQTSRTELETKKTAAKSAAAGRLFEK